MHTLSISLNTVMDQSRGIVGQRYISSGNRIWRETAARNFGSLTMLKTMDFTGPTRRLFGLVKTPMFLSAVSHRKLTSGAI